MIYVTEDQVDQVQYLLEQSMNGNHVLFDSRWIRKVFADRPIENRVINEADAYEVEHHLERILKLPTLAHKRHYLEKLAGDDREKLLLTYFNIIDNSIFEKKEKRH